MDSARLSFRIPGKLWKGLCHTRGPQGAPQGSLGGSLGRRRILPGPPWPGTGFAVPGHSWISPFPLPSSPDPHSPPASHLGPGLGGNPFPRGLSRPPRTWSCSSLPLASWDAEEMPHSIPSGSPITCLPPPRPAPSAAPPRGWFRFRKGVWGDARLSLQPGALLWALNAISRTLAPGRP